MSALTGSRASTEPCGLGPSGFDPERIATLESIIYDTIWMACRYAHGRRSYAVGMYNEAARKAVALGLIDVGPETFAVDGSMSAEMSGLTADEMVAALDWWSSPIAIRNHCNTPAIAMEARQGGDGTAPSRSDDSAARRDRPEPSTHQDRDNVK